MEIFIATQNASFECVVVIPKLLIIKTLNEIIPKTRRGCRWVHDTEDKSYLLFTMLVTTVVFVALFSHVLSAEEYVYIVRDAKNIPCVENPAPSLCTLDYKVPGVSSLQVQPGHSIELPTETSLNKTIHQIFESLSETANVSDKCKSAITHYFCASTFYVCQEDTNTIIIEGQKAKDACIKDISECPGVPKISTYLPCSSLKERKLSKRTVCVNSPKINNDPYPCTTGKYKEKVSTFLNYNYCIVRHKAPTENKTFFSSQSLTQPNFVISESIE